jgi:hypothetical protein
LPQVTVYYKECPICGQKWAERISQSRVIRLGKETFICKCKKQWPTGRVEWSHLSRDQRRAYFVSTAETGVLVISTIMPALFGYFVGNGGPAALRAGIWGLGVGVLLAGVLWMIKLWLVALSLRRSPVGTPNPNDQQLRI